MLVTAERAREIKAVRDRLRNPVNGRVSDESEIISAPEQRRRLIETRLAEEASKRAANVEAQWQGVISRLITAADKKAAEIAEHEAVDGAITMEVIIRVVCGLFHIKRIEMISTRRTDSVVYPRHLAMYLCRMHTKRTTPEIGAKFERDHSTVIYAFQKITAEVGLNSRKVITDIARLRHVLGVE